jgi:4-aminobutyrate aminotransferase-like enzyme/Ser/Thr protein kinase RdoA (MazF antagonist)
MPVAPSRQPNTPLPAVPAAPFSLDALSALVERHFGITGTAHPLPGERDLNFRVDAGDTRYVLKVHGPDADDGEIDLQTRALDHVQARAPHLPVPRVLRTRSGDTMIRERSADGMPRSLRLLSWVPGTSWRAAAPHSTGRLAALGGLVARLDRALADFSHDRMRRHYLWAMHLAPSHRVHLSLIADPVRRAAVERTLDHFESAVAPRLAVCRSQVIHNDASEDNIIVGTRDADVGLIDFGDVVHSPAICGLAVACAYAMLGAVRPVREVLPLITAYDAVTPLTDLELELLFDLIRTRLAMSLAMAAWQRAANPANEYLLVSQDRVWALAQQLDLENRHLAHFTIRDACGRAPNPASPSIVRWLQAHADTCADVCGGLRDPAPLVFDLSATGEVLRQFSGLPDVRALDAFLFGRMRDAGARVGIGRYREPRSLYRAPHFETTDPAERRSVHMGIDLFVEAGTPIVAPLAGVVEAFANRAADDDYGPVIILRHETSERSPFWTLYGHLTADSLDGLTVGRRVARGEEFCRIGTFPQNGNWPPHLHFQIMTHLLDLGTAMDGVAAPSLLDVFESVSPDPNLILGISAPVSMDVPRGRTTLARRRTQVMGRALSLSYDEPLEVVRGDGQFLYDETGRAYLDMVNNVCHVGHCHPRVVRAGQSQMAELNTNTRYLHDAVVEYARRLTTTMPEPLRVCFFVNSGSEANDLALRLARAHTRRHDVLVVDHAYHGNLTSLVELSPYKFNGAGGAGRPAHVRVCEMPDGYRGRIRASEPDCGERYAEQVEREIHEMRREGRAPAAFFAESASSCGGQIIFPSGYLTAAFRHARAAGAVCVADEVQTGLGRCGTHMWMFETQGVVPDIVTLGKPIGNGHPLAAVVTTPEIAASFANGMEYFNTFGGNPVSARIGLAVLDVIRDERLMPNARRTGDLLMAGVRALAERHPVLGDVRGLGLFVGIELVRHRETLEPAPDETRRVVEEAKRRGVLLSIDGPHHNVLKIKPPIAMREEHVALFLRVLGESLQAVEA